MLAELSVFPLDKGSKGLSRYVAKSIEIIEASGLDFEVHALGTLIEGPADKIFEVVRACHEHMAKVSDRVVTTLKIDDKKGMSGQIRAKVGSVEEKLGHKAG
ncbi:MAG: MTH1187 family thiamine-binding protein [Deltaproteobacteria bacterium]